MSQNPAKATVTRIEELARAGVSVSIAYAIDGYELSVFPRAADIVHWHIRGPDLQDLIAQAHRRHCADE